MGVRDEQEVDRRELAHGQRGGDVAARAAGDEAQADADAVAEDGIGEDRHAADAEEHGGVAEPGGGERLVLPVGEVGLERRGGGALR